MKTEQLLKLISQMNRLLILRSQISMDGAEYRERNEILDKQRSVVKAHNELKDLINENQEYKDFQVFLLEKHGLAWFEENNYNFDHRTVK